MNNFGVLYILNYIHYVHYHFGQSSKMCRRIHYFCSSHDTDMYQNQKRKRNLKPQTGNSTTCDLWQNVRNEQGVPETEEQQKLRFQVELEFVQCLGNPNYLNFLAQRGYFKDSTFINYLKYLLYWKEPDYAKYLKYPMCLYFLDLLQYEHFRRELVNAQCSKFIDDQQILLWQHYTRRRSRLLTTPTVNGNMDPNISNQNSNHSNGHLNSKIS